MKRQFVLGTLAMAGTLTIAAGAAQQSAPPPHVDNITVEKVKDNLFVLRGGGGNTAVLVTASGVTLVDTKNPGWGQPLLDKVKTLTTKPVTTVINTHTHYDHVSGNVELPADVDIVTHENTKVLMTKMNEVTGIGSEARRVQGQAGRRHAEANVQGQDDDRQGSRPDRPVLLRSRSHQRRRVGGVPSGPDDARR